MAVDDSYVYGFGMLSQSTGKLAGIVKVNHEDTGEWYHNVMGTTTSGYNKITHVHARDVHAATCMK